MTSDAELRAELRAATRAYLATDEPSSVGPSGRRGWTPDDWRDMANTLGLPGVGVAERHGGLGLGPEVVAMVHEELGRVLHEGPYLSTVGFALPALESLGRDDLVARVASGDAVFGAPARVDPRWPVLVAHADGVAGRVGPVRDATASDGVIVPARVDGEPALVLGRPARAEPVEHVDLTRPLHRVELAGAEVLATGAAAERAVVAAADGLALALAAECVGVAGRALELAVHYAGTRRQFGRAIGSFQAVQHQLADLLVTLELARSALDLAVRPTPDAPATGLAIARLQCGRSAFEVAEAALHLHGGIGFTWEHRMHLYFRRAKTNQVLLAEGRTQHDAIVAALTA